MRSGSNVRHGFQTGEGGSSCGSALIVGYTKINTIDKFVKNNIRGVRTVAQTGTFIAAVLVAGSAAGPSLAGGCDQSGACEETFGDWKVFISGKDRSTSAIVTNGKGGGIHLSCSVSNGQCIWVVASRGAACVKGKSHIFALASNAGTRLTEAVCVREPGEIPKFIVSNAGHMELAPYMLAESMSMVFAAEKHGSVVIQEIRSSGAREAVISTFAAFEKLLELSK